MRNLKSFRQLKKRNFWAPNFLKIMVKYFKSDFFYFQFGFQFAIAILAHFFQFVFQLKFLLIQFKI